MITDDLRDRVRRAGLSTHILNRATGISRVTFSYWLREDPDTRRLPRPSREPYLRLVLEAIDDALAAGALPARTPADAVQAIVGRMKTAQ